MKLKGSKCECGSHEFYASQICRVRVIVDGENNWMDNAGKNADASIQDAEDPYGPYTCIKCEKEYEDFE